MMGQCYYRFIESLKIIPLEEEWNTIDKMLSLSMLRPSLLNDSFFPTILTTSFTSVDFWFYFSLSFGRLEINLLAFIPLTIAWVWILGMIGLFDMRFNIVNIMWLLLFWNGRYYTILLPKLHV